MRWPTSITLPSWPALIRRPVTDSAGDSSIPSNKCLAPPHLMNQKDADLAITYADSLLEVIESYRSLEPQQKAHPAPSAEENFARNMSLTELTQVISSIDLLLLAFQVPSTPPPIPPRSTSLENFYLQDLLMGPSGSATKDMAVSTSHQTKVTEALNFFNSSSSGSGLTTQKAEFTQLSKNSDEEDHRGKLTNPAHQDAWDKLHGVFRPKEIGFKDFRGINPTAANLCSRCKHLALPNFTQ